MYKCFFVFILLAAKMRLREIEDVFNQRLSKLDHKDQQTARAIDWLRQNKSMFQQTIHLPVIVLVSTVMFIL